MTPSLSSLLVAAFAFAVAFGIAKLVTHRRGRRRKEQDQTAQARDQSRQVRRARERRARR
jgi:flagellar biosynthesis/type III secretory pathway M-ring protein FliF/YscJ